ncbi:MAG TPA: hypothetical protein VFR94_12945 [Nitrososphaeraceae archaeon]|nr:hypothetical protein [Nitrososphaeraceae archaeon]
MTQINDPFADWTRLLNKPVYSIDGKKIGFLRKVVSDYMLVRKGFIILTKYFIPTSLAVEILASLAGGIVESNLSRIPPNPH